MMLLVHGRFEDGARASVRTDQWHAVRAAVARTGDRFARLVSETTDPAAKATADWSVVEVAAHVASITWQYLAMVGPGGELPELVQATVPSITVDNVDDLNALTLPHVAEREPGAVAERVRADIEAILRATESSDPAELLPWLGGSRVPVAGVLAHLLNELLIHGWDVARANRVRWRIPPEDAAMFFELFFVGLLRSGPGRLLETDARTARRPIAVEFRSKHTSTVTLVLIGGDVEVRKPGGAVDVRIAFDPATFNLMMFGRVSKPRAVLTGGIVVWGSRLWRLPAFLGVVRTP